MRTNIVRPNLRVLKSTDVVQVLTAAEQRPAAERPSLLYPFLIWLALGFAVLCWVVSISVLYRVWHA